jgi:Beta-lactamase
VERPGRHLAAGPFDCELSSTPARRFPYESRPQRHSASPSHGIVCRGRTRVRLRRSPADEVGPLSSPYFPAAELRGITQEADSDDGEWLSPVEAGFDSIQLSAAVEFAVNAESGFGPDLERSLRARLEGDSLGAILGPMRSRGPANGVIIRHGYRVSQWGDPGQVDMTFSVTKSVLSTVAGLAWDRGAIEDLTDPIGKPVTSPGLIDDPHNSQITWEMLLQQRSEWRGTLWGKPDVADRREGRDRTLNTPGTFWEYNDVRVNLATRSLLHVWERPLPEVLDQFIMEPIGASDSWEWHGYGTSQVVIAGGSSESVCGGGHWGGGLFISSNDLARLGYLFLRQGQWRGTRVLSPEWIDLATTPTEIRPTYGFMWWLKTDGKQYPSAPGNAYFAVGGGSNVVWIDPENDLVVVVRWIDGPAVDEFIGRVLGALEPK